LSRISRVRSIPVDAAFGGFIGVPVAHDDAVWDLDPGVAPERDDQVDGAQHLGIDRLRDSPVLT
jgi:hypothetical protein